MFRNLVAQVTQKQNGWDA